MPFAFSQIKTKVHSAGKPPRTKAAKTAPIANLDPRFLFSFSGIKTAVLRYVELHNLRPEAEARREALFTGPDAVLPQTTIEEALALCDPQQTLDLIASFQHAVVGDLMKKTFAAAESLGAAASSSPAASPPTANSAPASPPKPPAAACASPSPPGSLH